MYRTACKPLNVYFYGTNLLATQNTEYIVKAKSERNPHIKNDFCC